MDTSLLNAIAALTSVQPDYARPLNIGSLGTVRARSWVSSTPGKAERKVKRKAQRKARQATRKNKK
jgi:hypothetical protein